MDSGCKIRGKPIKYWIESEQHNDPLRLHIFPYEIPTSEQITVKIWFYDYNNKLVYVHDVSTILYIWFF